MVKYTLNLSVLVPQEVMKGHRIRGPRSTVSTMFVDARDGIWRRRENPFGSL
jgi:hypothetical protein